MSFARVRCVIGVEEEVRILVLVPLYIIPALSNNNLRTTHLESIVSNLLEVNYLLHFIH